MHCTHSETIHPAGKHEEINAIYIIIATINKVILWLVLQLVGDAFMREGSIVFC